MLSLFRNLVTHFGHIHGHGQTHLATHISHVGDCGRRDEWSRVSLRIRELGWHAKPHKLVLRLP